jgi:hypothetical protein
MIEEEGASTVRSSSAPNEPENDNDAGADTRNGPQLIVYGIVVHPGEEIIRSKERPVQNNATRMTFIISVKTAE